MSKRLAKAWPRLSGKPATRCAKDGPGLTLVSLHRGPGGKSSPTAASEHRHLLLNIEGMHCASCVGRVEAALSWRAGRDAGPANLATNQAAVEFDPVQVQIEQLLAAVGDSGYRAELPMADEAGTELADRSQRETDFWRRRVMAAALLLAGLVLLDFAGHTAGAHWPVGQLLLGTILQLYVGWPYYVGAANRLRHLSASMDTLVALRDQRGLWRRRVCLVELDRRHAFHGRRHDPGVHHVRQAA